MNASANENIKQEANDGGKPRPTKNPSRSHTLTLLSLGLAAAGLASCGGGGSNSSTPVTSNSNSTQLQRAASDETLKKHLTDGFLNLATQQGSITTTSPTLSIDNSAEDGVATLSDSAESAGGSGFSGTNLVEAGVDEADVAKFDGDYMYIAEQPQVYYGWFEELAIDNGTPLLEVDPLEGDSLEGGAVKDDAFAVDGTSIAADDSDSFAPMPEPRSNASIHIFQSNESNHSATPVTKIDLSEEGLSIEGLYLHGSRSQQDARLINVSSSYQYGWAYWSYEPAWQGGKTSVQIMNINDINNVTTTTKLEWQGYYVASRKIGDVVYVVSRHMPIIDDVVFWPTDAVTEAKNRELIANTDVNDLIPALVVNDGTEQQLFTSADCFVSEKSSSIYERPSLLAVTAINVNDPGNPKTSCTNVYDGGVYASTQSLYIGEYQYSSNNQQSTRIHKFDLTSTTPNYLASGDIQGTLGWNDAAFRMSESGEHLRVITSEWQTSGPVHRLSVLKESSTSANTLDVVAQIPNTQQPATIGKPDEDIYAVRFMGDRAYVVTFERIDPLYVSDLSEPTNPMIKGELEIEGVSEYLQLLDSDTLLGVGSIDNALQISVFDVADISNPTLASQLRLGGKGTSSPAFYDYHALAWLTDTATTTTKLALPVSVREEWQLQKQGLQTVSINATSNQLVDEGFVTAITSDTSNYYGTERVIIDGNTSHYINGTTVWSAGWDTPEQVTGPQALPTVETK